MVTVWGLLQYTGVCRYRSPGVTEDAEVHSGNWRHVDHRVSGGTGALGSLEKWGGHTVCVEVQELWGHGSHRGHRVYEVAGDAGVT